MLPRTPSRCRLSVLGAADWRVGSLQPSSGTAAPAPAATSGAALPVAAPVARAAAIRASASGGEQKQQRALLVELVLREVADLAGGDSISADAPLMSAGLTSALAVQLVAALEAAVGAELPGTLVFDYPTGAALACGVVWGCSGSVAAVSIASARCLNTPSMRGLLLLSLAALEIADFMIAEGLVPAASLAAQLAPAPIPVQLAVAQVRLPTGF